MMRWHLVLTLFRKEITETLRDRRTLLMAIGIPVLLYPLIAIALTKVQESQAEAQEAAKSRVAVWGTLPGSLADELAQAGKFELQPGLGLSPSLQKLMETGSLPPLPAEEEKGASAKEKATKPPSPAKATPADEPQVIVEARALVAERKSDAVLLLWPGFESSLASGGLSKAVILYDSVRDSSSKAHQRLGDLLVEFRKKEVRRREELRQLPAGFSKAVEVDARNVAPQERRVGHMIGSMLPFLMIVISASGGLYAAIDLTAGEKERNTLQTLLCAPLTSLEIILGKFLAAWLIVLITTLANLASMAATFARILSSLGGLEASLSNYGVAFLVMLPVTFTVTALFLSVAVFARDFKDGQNLLTPMFMVLMLPLGATTLPGVELNAWTSFVPLVNIALLIRSVFLSEVRLELMFFALTSSAIYAGLALGFAARVFQQEQVLLGGRGSWRSIFSLTAHKSPVPTPGFALAAFSVTFVIVFYASHFLQGLNTVAMLLITQLGFFLAPNLAMAWRWGFSPTETYMLRPPPWQAILGAVLIGLTAWGVTAGIVTRVFPPPEGFSKSLEKVLLFEGLDIPLWCVWLLLGVTPAVCEELFFRGLVMGGFRKLGFWPALLTSSLLFAVAHSSIYRLLPTFILGMVLGFAAWRTRSLFTSILIHAINNSLLATFLHKPEWLKALGLEGETSVPMWLAGVTLLGTLGGLWLVRKANWRMQAGVTD